MPAFIIALLFVCAPLSAHAAEPATKTEGGSVVSETAARAEAMIRRGAAATQEFFSDSAITARIKKRLFIDEKIDGTRVKITTRSRAVIVEGDLDSGPLVNRAMAIIRATEGVDSAENHMKILYREPVRSDSDIALRVKRRFSEDRVLKKTALRVVSLRGVVTLSGSLLSERQAFRAIAIARATAGVKEVKNEIFISRPSTAN